MSAQLTCTFDLPRGQGGNRGPRATVLNELRATQQHNETHEEYRASPDDGGSPIITTTELDTSTVEACIEAYLNHIHRVVPLLDTDFVRVEASLAATSSISRQLVLAFCAYVANFGELSDEPGSEHSQLFNSNAGSIFLDAALSVQDLGRVKQPSPRSIYISFFLYGAYAGRGDYRQAWFYLREATTLFMMVRIENDPWYNEKAQRSLFWILVISER